MDNKDIYKSLKKVIDEITKNAEINIIVDRDLNGKKTEKKWIKSGRYNPWKLEPFHVAKTIGITESQLVKLIYDTEDEDIVNLWQDFINFKNLVMFHNNDYSMIKKELAELVIKLYSKNNTMKVDVLIKTLKKPHRELLTKISKLEKEIKFLKDGKDGKFTQ